MKLDERYSNQAFRGYGVEFRPITPWDLPSLRRWRNSPAISQFMNDSSYIAPSQQIRWFESLESRVDQAHWVIWCRGMRTGYVNIRGIGTLKEQEYLSGGYYLADTPVRHGLLGHATILLYHDIIFGQIGVSELRDSVLKSNKSARRLNAQMGYKEHDAGGDSIRIVLSAEQYDLSRKKFSRYFDGSKCERIID